MLKLVPNKALKAQLPEPSAEQLDHSNKLITAIKQAIKANNNWLSFKDYMGMALYHPLYGYYTSGSTKFGQAGDFITAPELGPLFAYGLAKQIQPILHSINNFDILEFGAGSGKLAINLLLELEKLQSLPDKYYILEVSTELRDRQKSNIAKLAKHLQDKIIWLDNLPEDNSFDGIILANEVIDAMPIDLFEYSNNHLTELGLTVVGDDFVWQNKTANNNLNNYFEETILPVFKQQPDLLINNYLSEINLLAKDWLVSISQVLASGAIFIIDYGFKRTEYYHPDRNQGTLMCHYRHFAHQDPLLYPGLQDITAHVDFTSLAETAIENNLEVASFLTQAHFLLANNITEYFDNPILDQKNVFALKQQLKKLTCPSEMGELFKVLVLNKSLDYTMFSNLNVFDRRYEL